MSAPEPLSMTSSRRHLFLVGVCFSILWALFFILTEIYLSNPNGCGTFELATMHVFRNRFHHANFSTYTFDVGLGMNIFRLLSAGFGGILTIPLSLLPEKIHPEVLALLNALRLGVTGACFANLYIRFGWGLRENKHRWARLLLRVLPILLGLLTSIVFFVLCYFLHLPVADTFFLLPILLLKLQKESGTDSHPSGLSLSLLLLVCMFFGANVVWGLLLLPIPLVYIACRHFIFKQHTLRQYLTFAAAWLLLSCYLLPHYMQFPYACGKGEPASAFLQLLGNDTDAYHTDVTFHSPATDILLGKSPTLLITQVDPSVTSELDTPEHAQTSTTDSSQTQFQFLNDWIYSLWPSLPISPFQPINDISSSYTVPATQIYSFSNMFAHELYCAVRLPQRQHPVEVYLNDLLITTITQQQGTVMVDLGAYNVGQVLTLRLEGESPLDLANVDVNFAYFNTENWDLYTQNATFGITNLTVDPDGITCEAIVSPNMMLLTNIPYEEGWTIYFDGQKLPTRAYQDALLCADLPAGNSILHLRYTAPGSTLGGWISGISFLALAVYVTWKKR